MPSDAVEPPIDSDTPRPTGQVRGLPGTAGAVDPAAAIEPPSNSHRPDTPFGCAATWGPLLAPHGRGLMADMRLHICNFHRRDHTGPCQCKCGSIVTHDEE